MILPLFKLQHIPDKKLHGIDALIFCFPDSTKLCIHRPDDLTVDFIIEFLQFNPILRACHFPIDQAVKFLQKLQEIIHIHITDCPRIQESITHKQQILIGFLLIPFLYKNILNSFKKLCKSVSARLSLLRIFLIMIAIENIIKSSAAIQFRMTDISLFLFCHNRNKRFPSNAFGRQRIAFHLLPLQHPHKHPKSLRTQFSHIGAHR